jgi:hypothetical protein
MPFTIEKHVPLPDLMRHEDLKGMPLNDMEVGDSFFVNIKIPEENNKLRCLRTKLSLLNRTTDKRYSAVKDTQYQPDPNGIGSIKTKGYRVFRIE